MVAKRRDWHIPVKEFLEAQFEYRDLTRDEAGGKFGAIEVKDGERNASNNIARGRFAAGCFIRCMGAISRGTAALSESAA